MTEQKVFEEISREREYQKLKWKDLDDRNNASDFLCYMQRYYDKAIYNNNPDNIGETVEAVVKLTALGVACLERFGDILHTTDEPSGE